MNKRYCLRFQLNFVRYFTSFFYLFQSCSGPRLPCLAIAPSRNHSAFALVCEMEQKWVSFHINASPIEIFSFHFFTSLEYEWNSLWGLHDKLLKRFFIFRCFLVFSQNVLLLSYLFVICVTRWSFLNNLTSGSLQQTTKLANDTQNA